MERIKTGLAVILSCVVLVVGFYFVDSPGAIKNIVDKYDQTTQQIDGNDYASLQVEYPLPPRPPPK
ncbi:hypothetical protein ISS37_10490 [candidate division KSB1 bacterium]|nr:hypothetical protein [candidate division KSB1 bacterium]